MAFLQGLPQPINPGKSPGALLRALGCCRHSAQHRSFSCVPWVGPPFPTVYTPNHSHPQGGGTVACPLTQMPLRAGSWGVEWGGCTQQPRPSSPSPPRPEPHLHADGRAADATAEDIGVHASEHQLRESLPVPLHAPHAQPAGGCSPGQGGPLSCCLQSRSGAGHPGAYLFTSLGLSLLHQGDLVGVSLEYLLFISFSSKGTRMSDQDPGNSSLTWPSLEASCGRG